MGRVEDRKSKQRRETKETLVEVELNLDGTGKGAVDTQVGFLTHMLETFMLHGRFDLNISAEGDIHVDMHHLVEDVGITLGGAFSEALGDRHGINRAGFFVYPMDEAVSFVAIDLGGRPHCTFKAEFSGEKLGDMPGGLLQDFFEGFARTCGAAVHVSIAYGRSDHHKAESIFKGFGRALRMAASMDPRELDGVPSTKGVLL